MIVCGLDLSASDLVSRPGVSSEEACIATCSADAQCVAAAFDTRTGVCYEKSTVAMSMGNATVNPDLVFAYQVARAVNQTYQDSGASSGAPAVGSTTSSTPGFVVISPTAITVTSTGLSRSSPVVAVSSSAGASSSSSTVDIVVISPTAITVTSTGLSRSPSMVVDSSPAGASASSSTTGFVVISPSAITITSTGLTRSSTMVVVSSSADAPTWSTTDFVIISPTAITVTSTGLSRSLPVIDTSTSVVIVATSSQSSFNTVPSASLSLPAPYSIPSNLPPAYSAPSAASSSTGGPASTTSSVAFVSTSFALNGGYSSTASSGSPLVAVVSSLSSTSTTSVSSSTAQAASSTSQTPSTSSAQPALSTTGSLTIAATSSSTISSPSSTATSYCPGANGTFITDVAGLQYQIMCGMSVTITGYTGPPYPNLGSALAACDQDSTCSGVAFDVTLGQYYPQSGSATTMTPGSAYGYVAVRAGNGPSYSESSSLSSSTSSRASSVSSSAVVPSTASTISSSCSSPAATGICPAADGTIYTDANGIRYNIFCGMDVLSYDYASAPYNDFPAALAGCDTDVQCAAILYDSAAKIAHFKPNAQSMKPAPPSSYLAVKVGSESSSSSSLSSAAVSTSSSVAVLSSSSAAAGFSSTSSSTSSSASPSPAAQPGVYSTTFSTTASSSGLSSSQAATSSASSSKIVTSSSSISTSTTLPVGGSPVPLCPGSNGAIYTDATGRNYTVYCDSDSDPPSYAQKYLGSYQACIESCDVDLACKAVAFNGNDVTGGSCYYKSSVSTIHVENGVRLAVLVDSAARYSSSSAAPSASASASPLACPAANGTTYLGAGGRSYTIYCNTDSYPGDYFSEPVTSFSACIGACDLDSRCKAVTFDGIDNAGGTTCYSKDQVLSTSPSPGGVRLAVLNVPPASSTASGTAGPNGATTITGVIGAPSPTTLSPPLCPGANNTYYTDSAGYTYLLYCDLDSYPLKYNQTYEHDFQSCITACEQDPRCGSVVYDGQDVIGVCYYKDYTDWVFHNNQAPYLNMAIRVGRGIGDRPASTTTTASSTSTSLAPSVTPVCPSRDGTTYTDAIGTQYNILCDMDCSPASFNQSFELTFNDCMSACDEQSTPCGAVAYEEFGSVSGGNCYFKPQPTLRASSPGIVLALPANGGNSIGSSSSNSGGSGGPS